MNLVEGISREIERVGRMKVEAEKMRGMPGVNMEFYIAGCSAAVEEGHAALGSNDIRRMMSAYSELEGIN